MSIGEWHTVERVKGKEGGLFTEIGKNTKKFAFNIKDMKENLETVEEDINNWKFERLKKLLDGVNTQLEQIKGLEELLQQKSEEAVKLHIQLATIEAMQDATPEMIEATLVELTQVINEIRNIEKNINAISSEMSDKLGRFRVTAQRYYKYVSQYLGLFENYTKNEERIFQRIRKELKKIEHAEEDLESDEKKMIKDGLIVEGLVEVKPKAWLEGTHDLEILEIETINDTQKAMKHVTTLKQKLDQGHILPNMPKKIKQAYNLAMGMLEHIAEIFNVINTMKKDIAELSEGNIKVDKIFYERYSEIIHTMEEKLRKDMNELKIMHKDISRSVDGLHEMNKHVSDVNADTLRLKYLRLLEKQIERYKELKGPNGTLQRIQKAMQSRAIDKTAKDVIERRITLLRKCISGAQIELEQETARIANIIG